jgi:hypothetical protein
MVATNNALEEKVEQIMQSLYKADPRIRTEQQLNWRIRNAVSQAYAAGREQVRGGIFDALNLHQFLADNVTNPND